MSKNILSTDPRKPAITTALKAISKCRKVTMVEEVSPGVFKGNCLNPSGQDSLVGFNTVNLPELATPAAPRKSGPKKAIIIQEACSADGCLTPPAETLDGLRLCSVHATAKVDAELAAKQAKAVKAPKAKKPTKTQVEADVELAKATLPPELLADFTKAMSLATKSTPIPAPQKAPAKPAKASKPEPKGEDVSSVIAQLLAKGWTFRTIGKALGGLNAGYARDWATGVRSRRAEAVKALVNQPVPVEQAAAPAPKEVKGSIKAPTEAKAAKAVKARPEADPRQMRLALEAIHDAVGMLLRKGAQ